MPFLPLLLALSLLDAPPDKLADARAQIEAGQAHAAANTLATMLKAKEGDEHAVRMLLAEAQIADGAPDRALITLDGQRGRLQLGAVGLGPGDDLGCRPNLGPEG